MALDLILAAANTLKTCGGHLIQVGRLNLVPSILNPTKERRAVT